MRLRTKFLASTAAIAVAGTATFGVRADAAPEIPWAQRPVTVGTGFLLGNGDARAEFVSQSGRWVVFRSSSTNLGVTPSLLDPERVYLRDRWTDTTTVLPSAGGSAQRPVAISADGNLIAGVSDGNSAPTIAWIYRHSTGRLVILDPEFATRFSGTIIDAINNDGYFMVRSDVAGLSTSVIGQLRADGSIAPPVPVATPDGRPHNQAVYQDFTPSLRYGVAIGLNRMARVDMRTGATDWLDNAKVLPPDFDQIRAGNGLAIPAWISANGRYVAFRPTGVTGGTRRFRAIVWDVTAGTVTDASPTTAVPPDILEVLNDGRVIYALPLAGSNDDNEYEKWDAWISGPSATAPVRQLNLSVDGQRIPVLGRGGWGHPTVVATDISRILLCGFVPYSSFDTNQRTDCYLRPF